MPRYDHKCPNEECELYGKVTEVKMSMDEVRNGVKPVCTSCGEEMTRKFHRLRINRRQPLGSKGEVYTDLQSAEDQLYSMILESEN